MVFSVCKGEMEEKGGKFSFFKYPPPTTPPTHTTTTTLCFWTRNFDVFCCFYFGGFV